jgi:thioredoxin-like negative regulator of GroEL
MKILRFYAEWCAPCAAFVQVLRQAKEKMGGEFPMPMDSVNIEENIMESINYDIKNIPTLVMIDDKRNEIKRSVGVMSVDQTIAWMNDTTPASKSVVKEVKKPATKKAAAKKTPAKKVVAKKAPAKKVVAKTPAKKTVKPKAK